MAAEPLLLIVLLLAALALAGLRGGRPPRPAPPRVLFWQERRAGQWVPHMTVGEGGRAWDIVLTPRAGRLP